MKPAPSAAKARKPKMSGNVSAVGAAKVAPGAPRPEPPCQRGQDTAAATTLPRHRPSHAQAGESEAKGGTIRLPNPAPSPTPA